MSTVTAVLIRPGCTDFDSQNRIQGTLDIQMNAQGKEQVHCLAEQLREIPVQVIYTAPENPARETAESLRAELGVTVKEVSGLSNLNQGLWQGMQIDEIRHKHPKVFKQWQESPETICPPEGEAVGEAMKRIGKVVDKILKRKTECAIVASEPIASMIRCHVSGCKLEGVVPVHACDDNRRWEYLSTNGRGDNELNGSATDNSVPEAKPADASA